MLASPYELAFHSRFALLVLLAAPLRAPDAKADFEASLQVVQRSVDARHFKEAKDLLKRKLEENSGQSFVREHLADIQATLKRCSFEIAHPRKQADDILCGDVVAYDPRSGEIDVVYKKDAQRKSDAEKPAGKDAPAPPFPCADFKLVEHVHTLELPFDGPLTLDFSGKGLGQVAPVVWACMHDDSSYRTTVDVGSSITIARVEGDRATVTGSASAMYSVLRPYQLQIAVKEAQIEVRLDGKRVAAGDKAKDEHGRIAFTNLSTLERLEIKGKANAAWIEERIEAAAKSDYAAFEKTYDAKSDLPEWLR